VARVLVVDDEPDLRELVRVNLARDGHEVEVASDGARGLAAAEGHRPHLMVLDVMMPGMDGWSVLGALKSDEALADIPVVMVTMVDEKRIGYSLGASDYLTKPIDRSRLVATIEKYRRDQAGGTILVVEDDEVTRQMVRQMLEDDGWAVVTAENGRIGLDRLEEAKPDLILLDLMMPEMDGFDFAAALRRLDAWRETPILVMTAMDVSAEDRLRLNGHVLGILQKGTYSRDALLDQIRSEIRTHLARKPAAKAAGS
jgi:CheY-like chemotaxis protein